VTPAPPEIGIVVLMGAVVFGLSTDYEVFLLSRMVEARTRGASTAEAVTTGLARTGRVISAAAILLIVVTGAFALSSVTTMRFVGVGMIIALLLDATVVRLLLVPALLKLLGDAAWWAPGPLRRWQERAGLSEYAGEELYPTSLAGEHAVDPPAGVGSALAPATGQPWGASYPAYSAGSLSSSGAFGLGATSTGTPASFGSTALPGSFGGPASSALSGSPASVAERRAARGGAPAAISGSAAVPALPAPRRPLALPPGGEPHLGEAPRSWPRTLADLPTTGTGRPAALGPGKRPTLDPDERLALDPGQRPALGPGERLALGPGQRLALGPGERLALGPGERLALEPGDHPPVRTEPGAVPPNAGEQAWRPGSGDDAPMAGRRPDFFTAGQPQRPTEDN
jgi:hypothetical protein